MTSHDPRVVDRVTEEIVSVYATDEEEFSSREARDRKVGELLDTLSPSELRTAVAQLAEQVANFS